MTEYTAYYVNHAGIIVGFEAIVLPTHQVALDAAHRLLIETRYPNIEVWDANQRIGALDRE